jgi:hypothetical protein
LRLVISLYDDYLVERFHTGPVLALD